MNYNLSELEALFNDIRGIILKLDEKHYYSKYTKLYLSNGENLVVKITPNSIPHLLGINTNYLQGINIYSETNGFKLLKLLCNDPYRINSLKSQGKIDYKMLFSKNIREKTNGFWENIKFDPKNTELVCKYDSSRCYMSDVPNERLDYAIIKNMFGKYYMLWLIKDEEDNTYVPMSSRVFDCYEDMEGQLTKILTNQEITILNGIQFDYQDSYYLFDNIKGSKIKNLKKYKLNFNCSIDVTRECTRLLDSTLHHKGLATNKYNDNISIIDCIKKGLIIDTDYLMDESSIAIANAFNDFLTISNNSINKADNEATKSYSKIKEELKEAKTLLLDYKQEIEQRNKLIDNLENSNQSLISRKEELETAQEKILKIINSTNKF